MSVQAITWALALKTGSATHKAVLIALANYANEDGESWHSQKKIADDTELSRHSVMRSIEYLATKGVLRKEKRYRSNGTRSTDMIILDLSCRELSSTELHSTQLHTKSHPATKYVSQSYLVCSPVLQQNRNRTVIEPSVKRKAAQAPIPFPDNFSLNDPNRQLAIEKGYSPTDVQDQIERIRDWAVNAGPKGRKRDWQAFARNWLKSQSDKRTPNGKNNTNTVKRGFDIIDRAIEERFGGSEVDPQFLPGILKITS